MIEGFCNKLTLLIKENVNGIDDEKAEVIMFGLHSLVSEFIKTLGIVIIGLFLGVIELVAVAFISFALYRTFAGGVHAASHIKCFLIGCFIIFGNIYISITLTELPVVAVLSIYIFNLLMIWFFAPADTEEKPIIDNKIRKSLKIKSFIIMSLLMFLAVFVIPIKEISNIIIIATFMESISLAPIMYKLIGCKYSYGKIPE